MEREIKYFKVLKCWSDVMLSLHSVQKKKSLTFTGVPSVDFSFSNLSILWFSLVFIILVNCIHLGIGLGFWNVGHTKHVI